MVISRVKKGPLGFQAQVGKGRRNGVTGRDGSKATGEAEKEAGKEDGSVGPRALSSQEPGSFSAPTGQATAALGSSRFPTSDPGMRIPV